jgi:hypothetical protein
VTSTAATAPPAAHQPQHGDAVAQWLERLRDAVAYAPDLTPYDALDMALADYRGYANERRSLHRDEVVTE